MKMWKFILCVNDCTHILLFLIKYVPTENGEYMSIGVKHII